MNEHWYMFDEDLKYILAWIVKKKLYCILTIAASRKYVEIWDENVIHNNDACAIEKRFATVPDW